jgi:hypothetical protein
MGLKSEKIKKSQFHGVRVPARLEDMIQEIQGLLSCDYSTALFYILEDWEKFRYLPEKQRLMELAKLKFHILVNHSGKHSDSTP